MIDLEQTAKMSDSPVPLARPDRAGLTARARSPRPGERRAFVVGPVAFNLNPQVERDFGNEQQPYTGVWCQMLALIRLPLSPMMIFLAAQLPTRISVTCKVLPCCLN